MYLFETNAVAFVKESRAAFFTSALVSQIASARIGTMSGIRRAHSELVQDNKRAGGSGLSYMSLRLRILPRRF